MPIMLAVGIVLIAVVAVLAVAIVQHHQGVALVNSMRGFEPTRSGARAASFESYDRIAA